MTGVSSTTHTSAVSHADASLPTTSRSHSSATIFRNTSFTTTATSSGGSSAVVGTTDFSTFFKNDSMGMEGPGTEKKYDAQGALEYIVVTLLVYALLGITSLLLVRIVRRAKLRHAQARQEEFRCVRRYLRVRPQLQMEGRWQKLMQQKARAALTLWKTDMSPLTQPLVTLPPSPSHLCTPSPTKHQTAAFQHHQNPLPSITTRTDEEESDPGAEAHGVQVNKRPSSSQHDQMADQGELVTQRDVTLVITRVSDDGKIAGKKQNREHIKLTNSDNNSLVNQSKPV